MAGWLIRESELTVKSPDVLGTIFCVGNGRWTTRGTLPEEGLEAFRGTYLAGLYTKAPWGLVYFMAGPEWLPAALSVEGQALPLSESERILDLRAGVVTRTAVVRHQGLHLAIHEERLASWDQPNVFAQRFSVRVLAGDRPFQVSLGLDGQVRNHRAKYYKPGQFPNSDDTGLALSRVEALSARAGDLRVVLRSRSTEHRAAAQARITQAQGPALKARGRTTADQAQAVFTIDARAHAGQTFVFDKVGVLTGDLGDFEAAVKHGRQRFARVRGESYEALRQGHVAAMERFWQTADVQIEGDDEAQTAVRFALWSTLIAAGQDDGHASLGAKNLSGDWYRGAVFWDMEMFQLPLLAAITPARAANHVRYRRRRLDSARTLAGQDGYDGARYPWQSYGSGLEEPPVLGGYLYQQQHVNLAVAWGIVHYYNLTGDAATGIESIHRAGMAALGVGDQAVGADHTVPNVAAASVELLREVFARCASPFDPYLERSLAHLRREVNSGYAATVNFGAKK